MIHFRVIRRIIRNVVLIVAWYLLCVVICYQLTAFSIGLAFSVAIPIAFFIPVIGTIVVDMMIAEYGIAIQKERERESYKQRQMENLLVSHTLEPEYRNE